AIVAQTMALGAQFLEMRAAGPAAVECPEWGFLKDLFESIDPGLFFAGRALKFAPGGRHPAIDFRIMQLRELPDMKRGELIAFDLTGRYAIQQGQRKRSAGHERVERPRPIGPRKAF